MASARELLTVSALLHETRELVRDEARAKSLSVIVVGDPDEVFVSRVPIVVVVTALLRDAIRTATPGGRVAVTAQEIERELVFAVYGAGRPPSESRRLDGRVTQTAESLGGRIWTAHTDKGNLSLFSVPLYRYDN